MTPKLKILDSANAMLVLMVFQQLIASSTHLFAKSVTTGLHPITVVFLRGVFSCLFFVVLIFANKRFRTKIEPKDYWPLIVLGFFNIPVNQLLFLWGVKYSTPANAALAYALSPAFVLLFSVLLGKERASTRKMLGVGIAFAGTLIVLLEKGLTFSSSVFWGNLMVLGASISWSIYSIYGKIYATKYGAILSTGMTMFTGLAIFSPLFAFYPSGDALIEINGGQWFQVAYLGIVTSGIGFGLWYFALSRIDASRVAVFNNLQPAITTVAAYIIFGQQTSICFLLGGVIAITGVLITQRD